MKKSNLVDHTCNKKIKVKKTEQYNVFNDRTSAFPRVVIRFNCLGIENATISQLFLT